MRSFRLASYSVVMVVKDQYYSNQGFKIRSDGHAKSNYLEAFRGL
jgi:hypothetical protein